MTIASDVLGLWFLVPQDAAASLVPAVVAAAIRDCLCLDVARYSSVRELRTLERASRSSQSLAHRTPTGTLIRSSPSFKKRERLNECSDPVRVLRTERGLEIVCPQE